MWGLVPWCVPAKAEDRGHLPQVLCALEGGGQDGSRGHRVYASAEGMGRDMEESVRDPRVLQVYDVEKGDAEFAGQSPGVAGQYIDP